ncbi:MAG: hypothetical protein KF726_19015 [Anaerolineae bacterium]|nr:hypothetical protein [Anaerolineae bacterium]
MGYWKIGVKVQVILGDDGSPIRLRWQGREHPIEQIAKRWRVDDGWWLVRVLQDHFKVITSTGLLLILTHDLLSDRWTITRLYD